MPAVTDEGFPPIVAALPTATSSRHIAQKTVAHVIAKKDRLECPARRRTEHRHDGDYCQRTHHARKGEWEHRQQQIEQISRRGWFAPIRPSVRSQKTNPLWDLRT